MLDISIPPIYDVITSAASAEEFCNQYLKIVEKLDGTKLTLIRNSKPFDKDNYLNNWIISYKEGVVFPEEFVGLAGRGREEEIRYQSSGRSQYSFVHEHLKRVHANTENFPTDYEFFIEFIQRKPTISRSYEKTGGLYLTGFGPTVFSLKGARVTSLAEFENDADKFEAFREALELSAYPTLFEGRWDSADSIQEGVKSPQLAAVISPNLSKINSLISAGAWKELIVLLAGAKKKIDNKTVKVPGILSKFISTLGGEAEGIVITPLADPETGQTTKYTGRLFKVTHPEQHSQAARAQTKQAEFGEGSKEEESRYHGAISRFVRQKIEEDDLDDESLPTLLAKISEIAFSMTLEDFADLGIIGRDADGNPVSKKTLITMQEDVISNARNVAGKRASAGIERQGDVVEIGVVPMAVKPLHKGHWEVIKQAAEQNDKVFLIVSAKARESGGIEISGSDMIKIWKRYLEPVLPPNVDISYSGEPVADAKGAIRAYSNDPEVYFKLYAGQDDADRVSDQVLEKDYPVQYPAGRVKGVIVKNVDLASGVRVKGEYMRNLLAQGKKEEFESLLPDELDDGAKESIWSMLFKESSINESILRMVIRECISR
jgi:hypothetical protein